MAKETHEGRGSRLMRSAMDVQDRGLRARIIRVLHAKDAALVPVARLFRAQGYFNDDFQIVSGVLDDSVGKGTKRKQGTLAGDVEDVDGSATRGSSRINKNFTRPSNMPTTHLASWLKHLEPVTYSDNNIKEIVRRGKMHESRERLCQQLEFATGLDPEEAVFEQGRDATYVQEFLEKLKFLNDARGRRSRDLILSWDWNGKDSNFKVLLAGSTFMLQHVHSQAVVALPETLVHGATMVEHFHFDCAWSEHRCKIRGPKMIKGIECKSLFGLDLEKSTLKFDGSPPRSHGQRALPPASTSPSFAPLAVAAIGSASGVEARRGPDEEEEAEEEEEEEEEEEAAEAADRKQLAQAMLDKLADTTPQLVGELDFVPP